MFDHVDVARQRADVVPRILAPQNPRRKTRDVVEVIRLLLLLLLRFLLLLLLLLLLLVLLVMVEVVEVLAGVSRTAVAAHSDGSQVFRIAEAQLSVSAPSTEARTLHLQRPTKSPLRYALRGGQRNSLTRSEYQCQPDILMLRSVGYRSFLLLLVE